MVLDIFRFQQSLLWVALVLPWISPWAAGPSPGVMPWLVTLACVGLIAMLYERSISIPADAVARAWLLAAAISSCAGLLQYLGLGNSGLPWLNATEMGEAFANLRQRNHFATLTSIGMMCLYWYVAPLAGRQHRSNRQKVVACAIAALLAWGNAASSSRSGMLELLVLSGLAWLWGGWRQQQIRRLLTVALASYGLATVCLPLLVGWDPFGHGMLERIRNEDVTCGSRLTLWSNVLHLISLRPWQGWGWGALDYAHFMTLYDGPRFCEILGNAHNLPLHLAVELGLPVAVLVCGAITWLVGRAKPWRETDPTRQFAWGVLALIAVHSMLEYPLWYGPFQMAAGLSIGLLLWSPHAAPTRTSAVSAHGLRAVSLALLIAVSYAAWDYHRVSQIYLAPEQRAAAYREGTLEKIRDSWLFRDQVRFAELTLTPLTPENASQLNAMAHELLHFSPEASVVEKLIESALLLGRDDEAKVFAKRYQAAYPEAYARWRAVRQPLIERK